MTGAPLLGAFMDALKTHKGEDVDMLRAYNPLARELVK
jgi:hypothetical protein